MNPRKLTSCFLALAALSTAGTDQAAAQVYGNQQARPQQVAPDSAVPQAVGPEFVPQAAGFVPGVSFEGACGHKQFSGFQCVAGGCQKRWRKSGPIPFQQYAQGEFIGPARTPQVPVYRLRPDDELECVYRITRDRLLTPYELNVGDQIEVKSFADERLRDTLIIQPDGTITLSLLGQVLAAGMTVDELRQDLEKRYKEFYNNPSITVTPLQVNTKLEDLRATVDGRQGFGGQSLRVRVTPDGTIALPAVENIPAQGLSLEELNREIDARYEEVVKGIEVTPVLAQRAPRYVYVVGEVRNPGRFTLEAPTTLIQSIALAGSWTVGGNIEQVVVFRRDENWCLVATVLDVRQALLGKRPCPAGEIWLRDGDIVIVPKSKILLTNHFLDLVLTRGLYRLIPGQATAVSFVRAGSL